MAEVQQLEDDEHYDISLVDGRCTLEMFGPRKSDAGQYLCIGVNELGQCSQSFQLGVKGEFRLAIFFFQFSANPNWLGILAFY